MDVGQHVWPLHGTPSLMKGVWRANSNPSHIPCSHTWSWFYLFAHVPSSGIIRAPRQCWSYSFWRLPRIRVVPWMFRKGTHRLRMCLGSQPAKNYRMFLANGTIESWNTSCHPELFIEKRSDHRCHRPLYDPAIVAEPPFWVYQLNYAESLWSKHRCALRHCALFQDHSLESRAWKWSGPALICLTERQIGKSMSIRWGQKMLEPRSCVTLGPKTLLVFSHSTNQTSWNNYISEGDIDMW